MTSPEQDFLARSTSRLSQLERKTKQLTTTATALSWGLLGSTLGYVFGSLWVHLDSRAFLSIREVSGVGYAVFIAGYTIFTRSPSATNRCLNRAKLLFIAEQVTEREYNRMRDKCLKKGELI
jgi:hypothetical protein